MKFSVVSLVTASVIAVGCAPRDSKIISPKAAGVNAQSVGADGKADNYKFMALLADRAVEAVELYRAVSDAGFAASRSKIKVQNLADENSKVVAVSADTTSGGIEIARDTNLLITIKKDDQGISQITGQEDQKKLSSEKAVRGPKDDVVLKNKIKTLTITRLSAGTYQVDLELREEINKIQGKTLMQNHLLFVFAPVQDATEVFSLTQFKMNHIRNGAQVGDFAMVSANDSSLQVEMKTASACSNLSGSLHLTSVEQIPVDKKDPTVTKPLYENILKYDQSNLEVTAGSKKIPVSAAACEDRSTVDISKLL